MAYGIFLNQGSNPCPLHWHTDSEPLDQRGSPRRRYCNLPVMLFELFRGAQGIRQPGNVNLRGSSSWERLEGQMEKQLWTEAQG